MGLFGTLVGRVSSDLTSGCLTIGIEEADQAEVCEDRFEILWNCFVSRYWARLRGKQDVARLDIPMDHTVLVCVLEGTRDGVHQTDHLRVFQAPIFLMQGVQIFRE